MEITRRRSFVDSNSFDIPMSRIDNFSRFAPTLWVKAFPVNTEPRLFTHSYTIHTYMRIYTLSSIVYTEIQKGKHGRWTRHVTAIIVDSVRNGVREANGGEESLKKKKKRVE